MSDEKKSGSVVDRIEEEMLKSRRIFLSDGVSSKSANDIIHKLWYLEAVDPGKPILFVINSPGGSVDAGFAVWDQAKMITSPITTLVTGIAASMGSILSLIPGKGRRYATKHCRVMIHQPSIHGVIEGQATDLEIQAKEILKTRDEIIDVYVEATGKDKDTVAKALDRDTWLTAEEAKAFGLIDKIVESYDEIEM